MTNRGRPLPYTLREQIKQQRTAASIRRVAESLRVSPNTVRKYGKRV